MPELPEVETMVRGIRTHVVGQTIEDVVLCRCRLKPISVNPGIAAIRRRVVGQTLVSATRWAKRIILTLEDESSFAVEPRMTGLMLVDQSPSEAHLRVRWDFGSATPLWFWDRRGLGTLRYFRPGEMTTELHAKLGPDALTMTPTLWQTALKKTSRAVKTAMLDQKLVAGIGNMYASEILFLAGVDPRTPANKIGPKRCGRIHEATDRILREAIRYEGSTLADGTYRNALNKDGSYQNAHQVYARADLPCFECGTPIRRIVQTQRSTFYCPSCQKQ